MLMIVSIIGPWVYDSIYVPSEYPCTTGFRVSEDICGLPLSGMRFAFFGIEALTSSATRLITGERPFIEEWRELLFSLGIFLFYLPVISMLILLLGDKGGSLLRAHIGAFCLALIVAVLAVGMGFPLIFAELWGIWFYISLIAISLLLELLKLRQFRPALITEPERTK
jgi:hypothetical protein